MWFLMWPRCESCFPHKVHLKLIFPSSSSGLSMYWSNTSLAPNFPKRLSVTKEFCLNNDNKCLTCPAPLPWADWKLKSSVNVGWGSVVLILECVFQSSWCSIWIYQQLNSIKNITMHPYASGTNADRGHFYSWMYFHNGYNCSWSVRGNGSFQCGSSYCLDVSQAFRRECT